MNCIICGGDTKVTDARPRQSNKFYRRRECLECGKRFTTYEEAVEEKTDKEKLIDYIQKLPDDLQMFKYEGDQYDLVDIKIFTKPKDEEFIRWYFGP